MHEKIIIEAVDATDDEIYYTVGLWATLEQAISAFHDVSDPANITEQEVEEYCIIKFKERKYGFSDQGATVAEIEWTAKYDEDGNCVWTRKPIEFKR